MKTNRIINLTSLILIIGLVSCNFSGDSKEKKQGSSDLEKLSNKDMTSLPANMVCMINDAYMGTEQIPVPVGVKVYYGCCEGCVDKLTNIEKTRYGIDPLTRQKVDKADAFIVLRPGGSRVMYFASKEHYLTFNKKSTNGNI